MTINWPQLTALCVCVGQSSCPHFTPSSNLPVPFPKQPTPSLSAWSRVGGWQKGREEKVGRCCNLRDRRGQMSSSRAAVSHPTTNKWQPHLFRRRSTAAYVFKMWQRPFLWLQEGRNREGGEGEHNWAGFNHEASARTVGVPPVCQRQCAPTRERSLSKLQGVLNSFTWHCYTATLDYRGGGGGGGGNIQRSTRAKVNSPIFNLATQIAPEECAVSDPI